MALEAKTHKHGISAGLPFAKQLLSNRSGTVLAGVRPFSASSCLQHKEGSVSRQEGSSPMSTAPRSPGTIARGPDNGTSATNKAGVTRAAASMVPTQETNQCPYHMQILTTDILTVPHKELLQHEVASVDCKAVPNSTVLPYESTALFVRSFWFQ